MKLTRREASIVAVAAVAAAGGVGSACAGWFAGAVACLSVLVLMAIALQLIALRRIALRQASLDRVERKMDVVARRVVTESEALSAEIRRLNP